MGFRRRGGALVLAALLVAGCASYGAARHYVRGSDALDRGDAAAAIAELERAAELAPEASEVHNHLGAAYAAAGRHEDAMAAFRHAVALDCRNESAAANLRAAETRADALRRAAQRGAGAPPQETGR